MSGIRFLVVAVVLTSSATSLAQPMTVGTLGTPTGTFGSGVTVLDLSLPATRDEYLTTATFRWAAAPCAASVKIKVVSQAVEFRGSPQYRLVLVDERGPFDVLQTTQTVALVPPLFFFRGSMIAIAGVTSCGGPVSGEARAPPGGSLVLQGDWITTTTGVSPVPFAPSTSLSVLVQASDDSLVLLKNRFRVTLAATDPRTGRTTTGRGTSQGDRYGFFSLPDFSGAPYSPEVVVKMADATGLAPPFGGSYWFFYSSLTDVQYTLTVTDQLTGKVRTYSKITGGSGLLCGGADTSAFLP